MGNLPLRPGVREPLLPTSRANIGLVARLIPNPAGDLWRRVDTMLSDVDGMLGRVDGTLSSVDGTLRSVDGTLTSVAGTLDTVAGTLSNVDGTLRDATDVLTGVRGLLAELQAKLELLDQVPALAVQLDEVHRIVRDLGSRPA